MAPDEPLIDRRFDLNPAEGTEVILFAIENSDYPGGCNYRFQYFQSENGDRILRYDNSQVPRHDAGVHHRHFDNDAEIEAVGFDGLKSHIRRFLNEVYDIDANR
jgi:hypothetical protein